MSLMSGRYAFSSPALRSDSTAGSCNESGSEFQTVGLATEKARRCQMCCDETVKYSVFDGWAMLETGNFGDWHAVVGDLAYLAARYEDIDEQADLYAG